MPVSRSRIRRIPGKKTGFQNKREGTVVGGLLPSVGASEYAASRLSSFMHVTPRACSQMLSGKLRTILTMLAFKTPTLL